MRMSHVVQQKHVYGEQDVLLPQHYSTFKQRQLHRLALEFWQMSPILPEEYVPYIYQERKSTNVD
jgi:pyridoxine/pyridoxamine 5'-phosphate oxidase